MSKFIYTLPVTFQDKILIVRTANPMYALNTVMQVADLVIALDTNSKLTVSTEINNKGNVNSKPQESRSNEAKSYFCILHKKNNTHNTTDCRHLKTKSNSKSGENNTQSLQGIQNKILLYLL